MSRLRTRVPRRYERPAEFRAPLGDHVTEAGIRAGYREGVRVRAQNARAERDAADLARTLIDSGQVTVADDPPAEVATVESADEPRFQTTPLVCGGATVAEYLDWHRRSVATVESAALAAVAKRGALPLREAVGGRIAEAPKDTASGRLVTIDIIRSGWNTSGSRYYPADVLERDVPTVYAKGTQVFIDHPSASETDDRPERSLQTLAGKFVDTPWAVRENDGTLVMRTTVQVFAPWQPLIRDAWDTIGVSINGNGRGDYGLAEGREGLIIDQLTYGRSVDFVTQPGAGGRVLGLLESADASPGDVLTREAGSLGAYVESRIHLGFTEIGDDLYAGGYVNRRERITLSGAIGDALSVFVARLEADAPQLYQRTRYAGPGDGDEAVTAEAAAALTREASTEERRSAIDRALEAAYGAGGGYCWVLDFDPDLGVVWFTANGPDGGPSQTYQQSYLVADGRVHLAGSRVQVRARTVYEPVTTATTETTSPAGTTGREVSTTETTAGAPPAAGTDGPSVPANTKEIDMGEKSPEVVAREAAEVRATNAELELARYRAGDAARPIIDALLAESAGMPEATRTRIRAEFAVPTLPLTESNTLDEQALRTAVAAAVTRESEYAAALLEAAGAGEVRGNGAAAGAGSGIPATFGGGASTTTTEAAGGGVSDATREALIAQYTKGGRMTREAAIAAVDGRF